MVRPPEPKVRLAHMLGEIPKLVRLGPGRLGDLLRAMAELAFARVLLAAKTVRELGIPDPPAPDGTGTAMAASAPAQAADIARISKAIAIVAPRVPWRSDCLVQCLAGRRWLATRGIEARISLGVKQERAQDGSKSLLAHAWLRAGDIVVTGGDVAEFGVFSPPHKP
ncbi:lasso peptide biosynthesis B2 protein [Novosphingobium sp.]|uniref:lasso peptide biosynthesis B2 protein n=1 Tax=Novosphingobium sp. TaxID=1874826 RepID=UPI00260FDD1A|nr:lasso peptide biosynthesis B2 protein [Novosphingobium sp.]